MKTKITILFFSFLFFLPLSSFSHASNDETRLVGTRVAPPFVMQDEDGAWHGLTIALWEHLAGELEIDYAFEQRDIQGLINGVSGGPEAELFASASALTITA
ncbi:transporter substrate-binding domain-containing protein, partial [Balneolaceae bacterium ANBcel3]|nr:transporter substrate-binding domain-containing protein [Balneolaceae bacterium ANBcel3]